MTPTETAIRDFCGHHADWWPSISQVKKIQSIAQLEPFKPDWDTEAVLVEEMQRMAKRIEELEAMPKEVDVKHKTKYYALLKEYDRVCYLLDKATDKITDQDLMLAIQTARIVDLQTHIENLEGEE